MGTGDRTEINNGKREDAMKHGIWLICCLLVALPRGAFAQSASNDTLKLGQRLFEQSCGVCHTRPTLVSRLYGPALSKQTAGGHEDVVRDFIANGSARMPGFKYTYDADQIAAIAAYLKTMPAPAAAAAAEPSPGAPRNDN